MTDRGSGRFRTLSDCQNVEKGTKKLSSRSQSADYWAGNRDEPPSPSGGGGSAEIQTPAGFRHIGGITNETVSTIQAAERELFTDLSRAQAFEDTDITSFAVFDRGPLGMIGKLRINVAQEREILGGAYLLRTVEINKIPGQTLGFYIREGDGVGRKEGIHVSRLMLGGLVEESGLIQIGDEILYVNNVDVTRKTFDEVYMILQIPIRLLITLKSRQIGKGVFRSSWGSFTADNISSPGRFSPAALGQNSKQRSISVGTNSSLGSTSDRSPGSFTDSHSSMTGHCEEKENNILRSNMKTYNQQRTRSSCRDMDLPEESEHQVQSALRPDMVGSSTSSSSNSSAIEGSGGSLSAQPLPVPVLRDFKLRHLSASDAQHETDTSPKPETFHRAASFDPSTLPVEEDSDYMVFVDDEDYDDLREVPDTEIDAFSNEHGLRSSIPLYSGCKKPRPYSAYTALDHKGFGKELDDLRDVHRLDKTKRHGSGKLRRASSSDDVIVALTATVKPKESETIRQHSVSGDVKLGRPRSAILEFLPSAMRRSGEGKARMRKPGQSEKSMKSSHAGKKSDKGSSDVTGEGSSKYVPKPSPDKKIRRISASKPLDIDITQFTKYKSDMGSRLRNRQMPLSGILTLHLYGSRKMSPSLSSKKDVRDLYCVMEVDAVHKAQTATVSAKDEFCWDEKFEIDLERAHDLGLLIYSYTDWDTNRQKLCYKAVVRLTQLLMHSTRPKDEPFCLAVRLEPRGIMYAKFSFTERHVTLKRVPSLDRRGLFGVPLEVVVRRENTHTNIPIIVQKCIEEIELRGINMVGVYRVCGSAKRKKRLHDEFEASSSLVDLSRDNYPDLNVITGVLKDYLRELPEPLFTSKMCQRFMDTFGNPPGDAAENGELLVKMIESLPPANKATGSYMLDHLKLIMVHSETNKMSAYNIAVCFGPVLMSAASYGSNTVLTREVATGKDADYEKHIEVLQTMVEVWPGKPNASGMVKEVPDNKQQDLHVEEGQPPAEPNPDPDPMLENDPMRDNQEEDSCYHSNDDLDETLRAKEEDENDDGALPEQPQEQQEEEQQEQQQEQHQQEEQPEQQEQPPQHNGEDEWDSDNLQVSPC